MKFKTQNHHVCGTRLSVCNVELKEDNVTGHLYCLVLQLNLITTWGDPHYVGLTGIAVLGAGLEPLPLSADQLHASPCDLNDLPEYTDDDRTLDKLGYSCVT